MSSRPCPNCRHSLPRPLDAASRDSRVEYYRCDFCEHVFNVPKDNPQAEPRTVAQGREQTAADW